MSLYLRLVAAAVVLAVVDTGVSGAEAQTAPEPQATPQPQATQPQATPAPPVAPKPKATPASPTTPEPPATGIAVPTMDIFDGLRQLRHKPPKAETADAYRKLMVAAFPVVSYNPASGVGVGLAGNLAFFRGSPETTSISSVVASLNFTSKGQTNFSGKFDVSTANNVWLFEGDNRLQWTNQKTYGLGTSTTPGEQINQEFNHFRFYETAYRQVRRNLYVGVGFLYGIHTSVQPAPESEAAWPTSAYVTYSQLFGFDLSAQTSAGATVHVLLDSRDSPINPSRGFYANLDFDLFFEGFLGGTSSWQQFNYDLRTYLRLTADARHRLAFWLYANLLTGGNPPYLDLAATSMDTFGRSGRGYVQGRFRGQRMAYGEVEYRWTITENGLLGMVAFLNTQTLSNQQTGERLFDSVATGAGFGLRVMLNRRSKTNLAIDVGRGKEGANVYFGVQEAF